MKLKSALFESMIDKYLIYPKSDWDDYNQTQRKTTTDKSVFRRPQHSYKQIFFGDVIDKFTSKLNNNEYFVSNDVYDQTIRSNYIYHIKPGPITISIDYLSNDVDKDKIRRDVKKKIESFCDKYNLILKDSL